MTIDLDVLRAGLQPHLESLKNLIFSYQNPLFWVFLFLIFLILMKPWGTRKAFLFSLILAAVLLATTALEQRVVGTMIKPGDTFDPTIIRIVSGIVIAFTVLYFTLIKEN
jgi:hypothetical protein